MTTAYKGGAIRKLSTQRGYAGGGLLDTIKSAVGMQTSKQIMDAKVAAEMNKRSAQAQPEPAAPTATAAAAPASAPQSFFQQTQTRRDEAAGLARGGAIKGPAGAMRKTAAKMASRPTQVPTARPAKPDPAQRGQQEEPAMLEEEVGYKAGGAIHKMAMAQKKSPEGGKLKGPGTATSDDIPAEVVNTGEPIKVATEERIVSKKQDAFLLKQAKAAGFDTVDAWLESGTGHPVGPTIKYTPEGDMQHASGGAWIGEPAIKTLGMGASGGGGFKGIPVTGPTIGATSNYGGGAIRRLASGGEVGVSVGNPYRQTNTWDNTTGDATYSKGGKVMKGYAYGGLMAPPDNTPRPGNTPYDIPGYTPGLIQRSGMGLAGDPREQGQTVRVPENGGDANSVGIAQMETIGFSKGGAIRRKMMPGRGSDPHGIRMGPPVQAAGAIRKMADGASPQDLRDKRLSTFPPGTGSVAGPNPTGAGEPGAYDDTRAVAREVVNDVVDAAKAGNISGALGRAARGGSAIYASGMADTAGAAAGALRPVGNVISNALTGQDLGTPSAPAAPKAVAPAAAAPTFQPAKDPAGYGAVRPATAPAGDGQPATLQNTPGKDVGYGVTRFDVAGKSPLFTNMTDAAGMASNEKLISRGAVSPQNQVALDGIQKRQDIGDLARATKAQYDAEVAGARAINTAPTPYDPEAGARRVNDLTSQTSIALRNLPKDRMGRLTADGRASQDTILKQTMGDPRAVHLADEQNATTRRGQDVSVRGQDLSAANAGAIQQLARQRLGLEVGQDQRAAEKDGFAIRAQKQIEDLHGAYTRAAGKDREAIAEQLRVMTGKDKPEQWKAIALQGSTDAMGNKTEGVLAAVNQNTGEMRKLDQGGGAPKAPPKPGEVIQGHKFKGGNPADQKNWEKV